jgi:Zn-dependent peptidase ImmA (M78 family)
MRAQARLIELLAAGDRTLRPGAAPLAPEFLRGILQLATKYARIERLVRGGTQVTYSPSALGLDLDRNGDVMLQGEQLAAAERARFALGHGPILELDHLIEEQGVKILPCAFPAGSEVRGGFFFDEEVGPCILVHAQAPPAEHAAIVAHQYGHFLADYDPYLVTLCGRSTPQSLADPVELRAHQFALAFLMPRDDLEAYRNGMHLETPHTLTPDFVRHLHVYFEAEVETVFARLLSLGWIEPQDVDSILRGQDDLIAALRDPALELDPVRLLPDAFVHLVASAYGHRRIELESAIEYLGLDEPTAMQVLAQFRYDDSARAKNAGPAAGDQPFLN